MTGCPTYDAVVVGAGPNGLAASVELASAVERILERGYPIGGAEDHGATISVYLSAPDGIELYYDRPREEWGTPEAEPFDPRELLMESGPTS